MGKQQTMAARVSGRALDCRPDPVTSVVIALTGLTLNPTVTHSLKVVASIHIPSVEEQTSQG